MKQTTLCYIEQDGKWLMLHRNVLVDDANKDKWIGVGGKLEKGESPEDCLLREVYEETGLTLKTQRFRGIITFVSDVWPDEYMYLFTSDAFSGTIGKCDEGELVWVDKYKIEALALWEGDRIFLRLLNENVPFFSLKLVYCGNKLTEAYMNGTRLEQAETT